MPARWTQQGYRWREECDADAPFLRTLYESTRADELARVIGWSDVQKAAFVTQQFAAQRQHFRTRIAGCRFWIIERDRSPVGRLYLQDAPDRLQIVDLALLPAERGKGLGTAILAGLLASADGAAKPVGLSVEQASAALRLYRRLGFVVTQTDGIRYRMVRPARAAAGALS
ncbi:GNAT family N-acetyltransferase [Sphingomonas qomolangmaensis]|uniref:GNAT family N-acetyltransferase n=1 Tax=Sphingomonas qomolangmaensis TaxID=2918765 RepID=A0ABY5L9B7_9SPHN|nr:GNAT family N-acetyltransferase [Sphingomonas qomolangmaensis]UUL82457.1 GNAT family N-acetyltransferase [Sphingomonas qomolangmaensis]